jgi:predicted P-loop ATPase
LPLNHDTRKVLEQSTGTWIVEAGDLKGMKDADINALKQMMSRRSKSRMAYGHLTEEKKRQFIFSGTTNEPVYFKDTTGNRRFWPIKVLRFDVKRLKEDRDQIWAEAFEREQAGASIRLEEKYWPLAAAEQEKRMEHNIFEDEVDAKLGDIEAGRIKSSMVLKLLEIPANQRFGAYRKVKIAMLKAGWEYKDNIRFGTNTTAGYIKNDGTREVIAVVEAQQMTAQFLAAYSSSFNDPDSGNAQDVGTPNDGGNVGSKSDEAQDNVVNFAGKKLH